jgi:hypothetical protein
LCDPVTLTIAATAVAAIGTGYQALSANAQAGYEADVAQENRKYELAAADDARKRGETEQLRHFRQLSQKLGSQRAALAASGLDVNFGSAGDLQDDTAMLGYEDSAIIAENTAREVKGFEINAANYTNESRAAKARGKAALIGGAISMGSTILGGATQTANMSSGTWGGNSALKSTFSSNSSYLSNNTYKGW